MRLNVLLLFFVVVAWSQTAHAFEVEDAVGGLSMRVEPASGERLCVAWPKGHVDPVGCEGFDVGAFEQIGSKTQPPFSPVFAAVLRRDASMMLVLVQRDDSGGFKASSAEEYMEGLLEGITEQSGGTVDKKGYRVVRVAERDAAEIDVAMSMPEGSPVAVLFGTHKHIALGAARVSYTISFSSAKGEATWLDAVASRSRATIEADPVKASRASASDPDERPRKGSRLTPYESGRLVGQVVGTVGILAFFVWLIVRAIKKSSAPRPPAGSWNAGQPPYPPHSLPGPYPGYPPPYHGPYPPQHAGHHPQRHQGHAPPPHQQPGGPHPQQPHPQAVPPQPPRGSGTGGS